MKTARGLCVIACATFLLFAAAAPAQDWGGAGARRGPRPGDWFGRMFERVARDLSLDEAQHARMQELVAAQQDRLAALQERWRALWESQAEGDEQAAASVREQLISEDGPGTIMLDVLHELEPELRDDQIERVYEIENRVLQQRERREMIRRLTVDLPQDLELDEPQQAAFEELIESRRREMQQRWQELREVGRELREASDAGNEARAAELRSQLQQMERDPAEAAQEFLDQVDKLLHPEQKAVLERYREELVGGTQPAAAGEISRAGHDLRTVLRAARRCRLSAEQREQLRHIEREAMDQYRQIRRADRAAQRALGEEVLQRITAILDPAQIDTLRANLARLERG